MFPGGKKDKPLSNMALLMLLRRMELTDITSHGFRSSFRVGRPLHFVPLRGVRTGPGAPPAGCRCSRLPAPDFIDKRVNLMADWAAYCTSLTHPVQVAA